MKKIILILMTVVATVSYAKSDKDKDKNKNKEADAAKIVKVQYPTVEMKASYIQKDKDSNRKYLNAEEREEYRVMIKSGLVYKLNGKIHPDTINDTPDHIDVNKYVMDASGNFYVWDGKKNSMIRHSGIFAGGPVAGGGEIRIKDGRIIHIDSDSGHYSTSSLMKNVLRELQNKGVDINGITN